MKVVATVIAVVSGISLKVQIDPHCAKGIMNTEMTACCQADCGECNDSSDICKIAAGEGRDGEDPNGRGTTCCPSVMLAGDLMSCDNSMAPCAVPAEVRNPPSASELASAERVAGDDCNEVVAANKAHAHFVTAYLKFAQKKTNAGTTECGTYGTAEQAAAACSNDDSCLGFKTHAGDADSVTCLMVAGITLESLKDDPGEDVYFKREDHHTGHVFHFTTSEWSACSAECDGGTQTRTVGCASSSGTTAVLGLCSGVAAMNEQAEPASSGDCNVQSCASTTTSTTTWATSTSSVVL